MRKKSTGWLKAWNSWAWRESCGHHRYAVDNK